MLLKLTDFQQNVKTFHILKFEAKNGQLSIIEENMGYVPDELDKDNINMLEYSSIIVYDFGNIIYKYTYDKKTQPQVDGISTFWNI